MQSNLIVAALVLSVEFLLVVTEKRLCVINGSRGVAGHLASGKSFCAYKGIPYAEAPIGDLRFKDPVSRRLPTDRNFTRLGSKCIQLSWKTHSAVGNEDCLYLNVYTTTIQKKKPRPILVWIHGGSFVAGSSESDIKGFSGFLENDIMVVTLNYRLGFLGFVSSRKHKITGNMGLKDQVVALTWVQKYAHRFGGDVNRVTLMGWSAGAASVTYHLYSEASKGLFHRAIAMSGSMLNPWAFLYASEDIMSHFFCGLSASKLAGGSVDALIPEVNMNLMFSYFGFSNLAFVPSQELRSPNVFLAKPPVELVETSPASQVPLMIGYTNLEVEFFKNDYDFQVHNPNFPNTDSVALAGIEDYLRNLTESKFMKQRDRRIFHSQLISKFDIAYGIRKLAHKYSNVSDVYVYQFAFNGDWNKKRRSRASGAVHGDDLAYLMYDTKKQEGVEHTAEMKIRRQMVGMWTNFIENGNPNDLKQGDLYQWDPYRKEQKVLQIEETLNMLEANDVEANEIWDTVYNCLYKFQCETFAVDNGLE